MLEQVFVERREIASSLPVPWVWAALTDADNIGVWSGFDRCLDDGPPHLDPGSERTCRLDVGGRPVHATLTVLEAEPRRCLRLRTEAAIATVYETIRLVPGSGRSTVLHYELDARSPLLAHSLQAWVARHVSVVHGGLEEFLAGAEAADGPRTAAAD